MPKVRRANSSYVDRVMASLYSYGSKKSKKSIRGRSLPFGDEKEWEETRCPICLEHPHNAVMLLCSSQEQGCRPFICDTSSEHSNCLKQFLKSAPELPAPNLATGLLIDLTCPLCRGNIIGLHVLQPARRFMDSKTRSCSLENCKFTGNYDELRTHARLQHPFEHPSEANATQQLNCEKLKQREIEEQLVQHSDIGNDLVDGTFSDLPSGMFAVEDALEEEICIRPFLPVTSNSGSGSTFLSSFGFNSPTFPEFVIDSGSSHGGDRFPWTSMSNSGSRPNNHVRNSMPRSRRRSGANGGNISRLGSGYQRQNDAVNLRSWRNS